METEKVSDDVNLANDKKSYDYEESISRTATTGSKVKAASADTSKNYYGFITVLQIRMYL